VISSIEQFIVVSSLGLFAGTLSAMTGGSGMIVLPVLMIAGVPPHYAIGTNKMYTAGSLLTSAITFTRRGLFKPQLWLMMIASTILGAIFGSLLVQLSQPAVLSKIIPLFLLGIAIYMVVIKYIKHAENLNKPHNPLKNKKKNAFIGGMLGLYSGFFGAGTGSICTVLGISVFKMEVLEAAAMSRFLCFLANLVALITFMILHRVNYPLGMDLVVLGSVGAYIGTRLSIKMSANLLHNLIIAASLIMGLVLVYKAWF